MLTYAINDTYANNYTQCSLYLQEAIVGIGLFVF
jgi:hypothetical protein